MKNKFIRVSAILISIFCLAFSKYSSKRACTGYYFWFAVQQTVNVGCNQAQYHLILPVDLNWNGFPDQYEVVQGNDLDAQIQFGCSDKGFYCCALGYEAGDIELTWDGKWRPKFFAAPSCIVRRGF